MRGRSPRGGLWVKTTGSNTLLPLCVHRSDLLKQKDSEIMSLLEEKVQLFRGMWEGLNPGEDVYQQVEPFFRSASGQEPPRGASVLNNALQEGKALYVGFVQEETGKEKGFFFPSYLNMLSSLLTDLQTLLSVHEHMQNMLQSFSSSRMLLSLATCLCSLHSD